MKNFYEYQGRTIEGEEFPFDQLKNHLVLIVNTASKWGFAPQFQELEELYKKYKDQAFVVLAFPSADFGGQEFEDKRKILSFARDKYGVTFPIFEKSSVRTQADNPLFSWLVQQKKGFLTKDLKWNFTKFLVDRQGQVQGRYSPKTSPKKIEASIEGFLKE